MSPIERAIASAMPRSSDSGPGWAPGTSTNVTTGSAKPLGELHHPHRLAVALGMGHPEVAPDVLVGVGALLLADDDDTPVADPGEARHDRLVVAEEPVAMQLDELVGHDAGRRSRIRGRRRLRASWTRAQVAAFGSTAASGAAAVVGLGGRHPGRGPGSGQPRGASSVVAAGSSGGRHRGRGRRRRCGRLRGRSGCRRSGRGRPAPVPLPFVGRRRLGARSAARARRGSRGTRAAGSGQPERLAVDRRRAPVADRATR